MKLQYYAIMKISKITKVKQLTGDENDNISVNCSQQ